MADFRDLVKQLIEAYERDVGGLRRELDQCKAVIREQQVAAANSDATALPGSPSPARVPGAVLAQADSDLSTDQASPEVRPEARSAGSQAAAPPADAQVRVRRVLSPQSELEGMTESHSALARNSLTSLKQKKLGGNLKIQQDEKSQLDTFVLGPLESIIGFIIMLNVFLTMVQLQVRGEQLSDWLYSDQTVTWAQSSEQIDQIFLVFEHVFNVIFLIELTVRTSILRYRFFRDGDQRAVQWFNVFDAIIVVFCSFDLYLTPLISGQESSTNLMFARMLRLARLARTLKIIQVLRAFSKLRILVKTVAASILSFTWSMAILGIMNLGGAIFICQMLQPVIADEAVDKELRLWLNGHYGTSAKSIWTMFEFTFSGGWPNYARPVIEGVHWTYSIFFALYVSIVVFAVIRIITALFLKDTLNVANKDAEFMVHESMKATREYAQKLKELFIVADISGNGKLDIDELNAICSIPEVRHYFHILEMDFPEVNALFDMLDSGAGQISYDEFVQGIIRLKGTARSMDVLSVMRACERIDGRCSRLESLLSGPRGDIECAL